MKNKSFTVTAAQLNTHGVIDTTTVLSGIPAFPCTDTRVRYYYPKRVQFINKSGQDVGVNIFSSPTEYAEYTASPVNFDFFTVPSATVFNMGTSENLPNAYKIDVQLSGVVTATGNLTIECIGYQELV